MTSRLHGITFSHEKNSSIGYPEPSQSVTVKTAKSVDWAAEVDLVEAAKKAQAAALQGITTSVNTAAPPELPQTMTFIFYQISSQKNRLRAHFFPLII